MNVLPRDPFKKCVIVSLATVGFIIAMPVICLVSIAALPFYALKCLKAWNKYKDLLSKTLDDRGNRDKFGRNEIQDYTRWDGRKQKNPSIDELMHQSMRHHVTYLHGKENSSFIRNPERQATDSPFKTLEDLEWLKNEYLRREQKEYLKATCREFRICFKASFPVGGIIWSLVSEMIKPHQEACLCYLHPNFKKETREWKKKIKEIHWNYQEALKYHMAMLKLNLKHYI